MSKKQTRPSRRGEITAALDTHNWIENTCMRCHVKREGPFAEHGNYSSYVYEQRSAPGHFSEYIPPCSKAPPANKGVVDTLRVCGTCGATFEKELGGDPRHLICWRKHPNKPEEVKIIKFCRSLHIPA